MKKMIYSSFLSLLLLFSGSFLVSQEGEISSTQQLTIEDQLTEMCVKMCIIISTLQELKQSTEEVQADIQKIEMILMGRGIKKESIDQLIALIIQGIMDKKDHETIVAEITQKTPWNNAKNQVVTLTTLLAKFYPAIVEAETCYETLQALNKEIEQVKDSLIAKGHSEEEALNIIKNTFEAVGKVLQEQLANASQSSPTQA